MYKIPNIIHQIWIQGYNQIPEELKKYHDQCRLINNNFRYYFWDNIRIIKLLSKYFDKEYIELYNYYTIPSQKADLSKYAILYIYGGIYLDMDMICIKNLETFLKYDIFFTTDIFNNLYKRYLTGIIGSKTKHPIFIITLKNMLLRKAYAYDIQYSAATKLFYDSIEEYKKKTNDNNIFVIDRKYLHPCSILDNELCPYSCTDCYVAHTNYSSWSPSLRLLKYLVRNYKIIFLIIIIILLLFYKFKFIRF